VESQNIAPGTIRNCTAASTHSSKPEIFGIQNISSFRIPRPTTKQDCHRASCGPGTVCITIAANIAETGILTFDACFPDSVIGVVTNKSIANNKFLEYQLQSFKTRLQALGKGSAQDNINMGTFENQLFSFPSLGMQARIVSTLDGLLENTQRLESIYQQKLAALEALKKSLLHEAFRGQL
jgi:type I restriction enzyme S subunit